MKEDTRKKIVGAFVVIILLCILAAVDRAVGAYAGKGAVRGPRGVLSACWHHTKCMLKPCDEDGRCPVWSSSYSKCYMLTEKGEKTLYEFQNDGMSKEFFEMMKVK